MSYINISGQRIPVGGGGGGASQQINTNETQILTTAYSDGDVIYTLPEDYVDGSLRMLFNNGGLTPEVDYTVNASNQVIIRFSKDPQNTNEHRFWLWWLESN